MPDEANFLEISNLNQEDREQLSPERQEIARQIGGEAIEGLVKVDTPEQHYLADQSEEIKSLVAGHDEDIDSIMHAISGQAFRDSTEPYSIFITGPEGSGKTETAQAISDVLADGKHIRVDCSMFREGLDPSAVMAVSFIEGQGNFNFDTEDSSKEPGVPDVVIFENVETASPSFQEYLSSGAMKDGKFVITTSQGMGAITVSNSLFLFTSRLGTGAYGNEAGYRINSEVYPRTDSGHMSKAEIQSEAEKQMKKAFDDDFLDMIGHSVYYESLSDADLGDVLDNYVANYEGYEGYGIDVSLSGDVRDEIVTSISENKRNATTVVRKYQRLIEPDLSRMAGSGDIPRNHKVIIVKEETGEYGYYTKLNTDKLVSELSSVRQQTQPLLEREEELIETLEEQGIGLDSRGNPLV